MPLLILMINFALFFSFSKFAALISTSQSKSNKVLLTWCTLKNDVFIIYPHRNQSKAWVCQAGWWSAWVEHPRGKQILYGTIQLEIVTPLCSSVQNWMFIWCSCCWNVHMFCVFFGTTVPYSMETAVTLSPHGLCYSTVLKDYSRSSHKRLRELFEQSQRELWWWCCLWYGSFLESYLYTQ